jgi:hypothetical protein
MMEACECGQEETAELWFFELGMGRRAGSAGGPRNRHGQASLLPPLFLRYGGSPQINPPQSPVSRQLSSVAPWISGVLIYRHSFHQSRPARSRTVVMPAGSRVQERLGEWQSCHKDAVAAGGSTEEGRLGCCYGEICPSSSPAWRFGTGKPAIEDISPKWG